MVSLPTPSLQFDRACRVVVGQGISAGALAVPEVEWSYLDDEGYRIAASIEKTIVPDPNRATIQIYNLSKTDRDRITALIADTRTGDTQQRSLEIFAGYGTPESIFKGDLVNARHEWAAPEWVTTLEGGWERYGGADASAAYVAREFLGLLTDAGDLMNLDTSTTAADIAGVIPNARKTVTANGFAFVGPARDLANEAAHALGVRWMNDDGKMVIVPEGTFASDFAVDIGPATGLLGNPIPKEFERYEARWLMNPKVRPGRQVRLQDAQGLPIGSFRVDKMTTALDTHGGDWSSTGFLQPARLIGAA